MSKVDIKLKPQVEASLTSLAAQQSSNKNTLINQAVKEYLQREFVEQERWQQTLTALDSVKAGRLIDEQSVNDWLDSWDTDNELEPPGI